MNAQNRCNPTCISMSLAAKVPQCMMRVDFGLDTIIQSCAAQICSDDLADDSLRLVSRFCMPWLLGPSCFLSACACSVSVAVCSIPACYVLLVGASVADAAMPAGERVFAAGLVHSCVCPLSLAPSSRVAWRCPPPSAPSGVPRPKPLWGKAWSPICFFLFFCSSSVGD
jgi:hypothetical protein